MSDDKTRRLYKKYFVERVDGKPVGHAFVLELKDPNTWPALNQWAQTLDDEGYGALAEDIRDSVKAASGQ